MGQGKNILKIFTCSAHDMVWYKQEKWITDFKKKKKGEFSNPACGSTDLWIIS